MLHKRLPIVVTIVLSIVVLGSITVAASWHVAQTPRGLEQVVLLIATGEYDEADLPDNDDLGTWFHEEIMGRTQEEIEELSEEADEYFWNQFGQDYDPATFVSFGVDPRVGIRAFGIGGMEVPREGFMVHEGGFKAEVLVDEIDGEEIRGIVLWGEMLIQPHRAPFAVEVPEEMAIRFRTESPIVVAPYTEWTAFELVLESELWGDGLLQAMMRETALEHLGTREVDVTNANDNPNDGNFLDWLLLDNNNGPNAQITPTPAPLETPPPVQPTIALELEEIGFWGLLVFPEIEDIIEEIDPVPEPGFEPEPPVGPTPPPIDNNNNND